MILGTSMVSSSWSAGIHISHNELRILVCRSSMISCNCRDSECLLVFLDWEEQGWKGSLDVGIIPISFFCDRVMNLHGAGRMGFGKAALRGSRLLPLDSLGCIDLLVYSQKFKIRFKVTLSSHESFHSMRWKRNKSHGKMSMFLVYSLPYAEFVVAKTASEQSITTTSIQFLYHADIFRQDP